MGFLVQLNSFASRCQRYILWLLFVCFCIPLSKGFAQPYAGDFLGYLNQPPYIEQAQDMLIGPTGNLLVLTAGSARVLQFDTETSELVNVLIPPDSVDNALIPRASFVLGTNNLLYILSTESKSISIYNGVSGAFVDRIDFEVGGWGTSLSDLQNNGYMAIGPDSNLYISSFATHEILRIDLETKNIEPFVSQRSAGLFNPSDITFGPDGHLYVFSNLTRDVFRFNGETGDFIDFFIEDFPYTTSRDIAFGPDGNFHILALIRHEVFSYDGSTGEAIESLVPFLSANLYRPTSFSFSYENQLYIASRPPNHFSRSQLLRFDGLSGNYIDTFFPQSHRILNQPFGLIIGPDSHFYVTSFANHEVLRYNGETGQFVDAFVPPDTGGLDRPFDLDFGPDGHLYVSSFGTDAILRFDGTTGVLIDDFVPERSGNLEGPGGLEFGADANLYVSSFQTDEVLRYDGTTGEFIDAFVSRGSGGLFGAHGLRFGPDGHLYVGSFHTDEILRYDGTTGAFIDAFVTQNSGELDAPQDHRFGPDGHLYVSSLFTNSVLRYDGESGAFIDDFVPTNTERLAGPRGLVFGSDNDLFVSSIGRDLIYRFASPLNISTSTDSPLELPTAVNLSSNYPNPFNGSTSISYMLDKPSHVVISVFDPTGRLVERLMDQQQIPGAYEVDFNAENLPAGVYFYRLQTEDSLETGKMVLVR